MDRKAKYHICLLEKDAIKSFQIVKKDFKFYVYVKVEYEVPDKPVSGVLGVDLGGIESRLKRGSA